MPLVEQELLTLPEHTNSSPICCGVRVTRSVVLSVCCVDRCLSFFFSQLCCLFSSIYGFWLPLYLVSSNLRIYLLFFYHLIYMECGTTFTLLELWMYCFTPLWKGAIRCCIYEYSIKNIPLKRQTMTKTTKSILVTIHITQKRGQSFTRSYRI